MSHKRIFCLFQVEYTLNERRRTTPRLSLKRLDIYGPDLGQTVCKFYKADGTSKQSVKVGLVFVKVIWLNGQQM